MFNIFKRKSEDQAPQYSDQELEEFLDGFRVGLPLVGQPEYPNHGTKPYKRGLSLGRQAYKEAGCPQIPYESSEE
jgi:hypothetical protein